MDPDFRPEGPTLAADYTILGPRGWGLCVGARLTKPMLELLLRDDVAATLVPGVFSDPQRRQLAAGLERHGLSWRSCVGVGLSQREYRADPAAYFSRVEAATRARRAIAVGGADPLHVLLTKIADAWPRGVAVAREPQRGLYFAGSFERVGETPLDVDYAPRHSPTWHVGRFRDQLRASVCLASRTGSASFLYRRAWTPRDDAEITPGVEPWTLATGVAFLRVDSIEGALLLTNARNFFRGVGGARPEIRFTASLGIVDDNSPLEAWS